MAAENFCKTWTLGSCASRIEWQLPQTTFTAWPKERMVTVAPQLGQLSDRTLTVGISFLGPISAITSSQTWVIIYLPTPNIPSRSRELAGYGGIWRELAG